MKNKLSTKNSIKIAILSAMAFVVMLFNISIPGLPYFYKLDLSEVVVLTGGFMMGPFAAIVIEALKNLLHAFTGSQSFYIGELSNFLMGIALVVPASYFYKQNKSRKNAVKGLIIGGISMSLVAVILNYFVLLPLYAMIFNISVETLFNVGATSTFALAKIIIVTVLIFNIIKCIVVSVVTLLVYKKISILFSK